MMMRRPVFWWGVALTVVTGPLWSRAFQSPQRQHLMPGGYRIPARFKAVDYPVVTSPAQLGPSVENCLDNWLEVAPGDPVRLVSDDSISPLVVEAFYRGGQARGLRMRLEELSAPAAGTDLKWEAVEGEATLLLAFLPEEVPLPESVVRVAAVPELLASDWGRLPPRLMEEIALETVRELASHRVARLLDPAGSDLSFRYQLSPPRPQEVRRSVRSQFPASYQVRLQVEADSPVGQLYTHSERNGFFPLAQLRVREGRLAWLQGGGALGEKLKARILDPERQLRLQEVRLGTSPAALRYSSGYRGSALRWGHRSGAQRAGVTSFHFSSRPSQGEQEQYQFQIYFPTLLAGSQRIVSEGYLETLSSPAVTRLAASLGATSFLVPQCGAESLPRLPDHENPVIQAATSLEELQPGVQELLVNWVKLGDQEKVLLLSDETVPPLLYGAFLQGLGVRAGLEMTQIPVPPAALDPLERLRSYAGFDLPSQVWEQIAAADVVIALSHFPYERLRRDGKPFREWLEAVRTRFVAVAGLPEVLASPWGKFPAELLRQLARTSYSLARLGQSGLLTTGEGSRLSFSLQPTFSLPRVAPEPGLYGLYFGPANVFFTLTPSPASSAQGKIITRQLEGMSVPRMELLIEDGKLTGVQGEGEAVQWLREQAESGEGLRLSRIGSYVNPKAFPWESAPYPGWTPGFWATSGWIYRSGILHVVFEGSVTFAVQLQIGNLEVSDRELIARGRLLALEDPNLRNFALQQSLDPDQWLKEDWMPLIGGR